MTPTLCESIMGVVEAGVVEDKANGVTIVELYRRLVQRAADVTPVKLTEAIHRLREMELVTIEYTGSGPESANGSWPCFLPMKDKPYALLLTPFGRAIIEAKVAAYTAGE